MMRCKVILTRNEMKGWNYWIWAMFNVQWVSQVEILNQKPCVLLFRRNLVRTRAS